MRTKVFCDVVERAMKAEYGDHVEFATVQYIPDEGGEARECLGIFVLPEQHMATVAARAAQIVHDESPADEVDDDLDDLVSIMHRMRVAPYMQWHCAYFPGLTAEQVLASAEAGDSVDARSGVPMAGDGPVEPHVVTPRTLFEDFDRTGISVKWYSGRGMAGVECLSISGAVRECRSAIAQVIAGHMDNERFEGLTETLLAFHQDQLGRGTVHYWPDLTKPADDSAIDHVDGSFVPSSTLPDEVQAVLSELAGMLEIGEIDEARHLAATRWAEAHPDDIVAYRTSMTVSEIADTVLSMSTVTQEK